MTTPTVSALIATYNRPAMVGEAIRSVLRQTYQDFELIVVDDGLRERANEVVAAYNDPRIRYIAHDESRGCAGSRVTGIKASKGKYVAFLDDDDTWEPEKLAIQVAKLKDAPDDVGFSFTAITQVFDGHTAVSSVPDGIADYYERALGNFSGFHSVTLMFKREVFDVVGMPDPAFPSHTDIEFILRVAKHYRGLGISRPLTRVNTKTDHPHMGIDFGGRIRGREMLLAKHMEEFKKRPAVLAAHVFKLGWFYRSNGQYVEARREYLRAFRLDAKPRYFAHYASMFLDGASYRLFRTIKRLAKGQ